jgi:CBS domain-containing protein
MTTVAQIIDTEPVTVTAETSIEELVRMRHNRLPMVEHGRLVGLVTRVGVLQALAREG